MSRPAIPAALKRQLMEESGYRCAVPTCNETSALQFEHIDDWAKLEIKEHNFDKMIILCPTCHARVTAGKIPKSAIRTYKRNLAIINGRYSLYELRLMRLFFEAKMSIKNGKVCLGNDASPFIKESDRLHLWGLENDGLISFHPIAPTDQDREAAKRVITSGKKSGNSIVRKALIDHGEEGAEDHILTQMFNMQGKASYFVFPTIKGMKFVNDYFSGEEIE